MAQRSWTSQRAGNWSLPSNNVSSPWYDNGTQSGYTTYPAANPSTNHDIVTVS
jgi:hypothetical protein